MAGVGISFGNSSTFVALNRDGRSEIIANSAGERSTCTTVSFQEGEILTGTPALQMAVRQPQNSVNSLKSMMGCTLDAYPGPKQDCRMDPHADEIIINFSNSTRKGVSTLVKSVFENLKETVDSSLGEGKHDTVITVPVAATPAFQKCITKSATAAGFTVTDLIPEPVAALLHHSTNGDSHGTGHDVVLRIGGATMSVTLVKKVKGVFSIVDHTEERAGGNLFDQSVGKFFCGEFNRKNRCKMEENARSLCKVLKMAKSMKHHLSTLNTTESNIECLFNDTDFVSKLSRPRFETIIQDDLSKISNVVKTFMSKYADLAIDRVILSGGSCRVVKLQTTVTSLFTNSRVISDFPDEVQALGAATHSDILKKFPALASKVDPKADGTVSVPALSAALEVRVGDEVVQVVPQHTPLPHSTEINLPEGPVFCLQVGNKVIAKAELSEDKGQVSLHLEIGEDCSIEGILKDLASNERTSFSVPAPTGA